MSGMRLVRLCAAIAAVSAASACGGAESDCSPACRSGYECFHGICLPAADASDAPDDAPPGRCSTHAACADGNPCTADLCDVDSGTCSNPIVADGTACPDDGRACTPDVCAAGVCTHPEEPPYCCRFGWQCDDGDPCTDDACVEEQCRRTPRDGCCTRDADCLADGREWECNAATTTCYDPPAGGICAACIRRTDCGDGGSSSDDWCVYYGGATDAGCSKDCIDDLDCPSATQCVREGRPCRPAESGCYCTVRVGNCNVYNRFGDPCGNDAFCRTCSGCSVMVCRGGYCTWPCTGDRDCRWGSRCTDNVCA